MLECYLMLFQKAQAEWSLKLKLIRLQHCTNIHYRNGLPIQVQALDYEESPQNRHKPKKC